MVSYMFIFIYRYINIDILYTVIHYIMIHHT